MSSFIPTNEHALFQAACKAHEAGDMDTAIVLYKKVIALAPARKSAWINMGVALRRKGQLNASLAATTRAYTLDPHDTMAMTNMANCLTDLDRLNEALDLHRRAIALQSDDSLLHKNLAITLREAGLFEEGLATLDKLLAVSPEDTALQWERALMLLYMGDYAAGWNAFECRWNRPPMQRPHVPHSTPWQGEDLKGKSILVYEEQGFGDSILCSRFIPLLHAMGANVTVQCKSALHELFFNLPCHVIETIPIDHRYDYMAAMMSLPGMFSVAADTIPPAVPLTASITLPPVVTDMLAMGHGLFKIGIVWSGSVTFANNRKRAVPAERFLDFAHIPGVQLYSLQKGPHENDMAMLGADGIVPSIGPHLENFAQTAAVLNALDLVIMTDSSVAHLAGAMNVPVWNLLSHRPYWLYQSEREDCPWYPSMRLFRQTQPGNWDAVFQDAGLALRDVLKIMRS